MTSQVHPSWNHFLCLYHHVVMNYRSILSPFTDDIMRFREINILVNRPHANWLNELNKKTFIWINLKVGQIYVLHSWWLLWERWKERTGEEWRPRQDSKADSDQNDSNFQVPLGPLSQAATSSLQSTRTSELPFHPSWKISNLPFHPFRDFLKFRQYCSSNNLCGKLCENQMTAFSLE